MDLRDTKENGGKHRSPKMVSGYVYYTGMGFQMIAIIGVFTYIGYRIDHAGQGNSVLCTALFSLLGVLISLYMVIKSVMKRRS